MPPKVEIELLSEDILKAVKLPEQTKSYTVISHGFIIDKVDAELAAKGFVVTKKEYLASEAGEIARGIVHIENDKDPDMKMVFTWINSYNKKVKFSCSVGGFIVDNNSLFVGSEGTSWIRKHTGTALDEAKEIIEQIVSGAEEMFDKIISEKNQMKAMPLSVAEFACIMGSLYFEHELMTTTHSSAVLREWKKPEHQYNDKDTLWGLYKIIMFGMKDAPLVKWDVTQQKIHHLIMNQYLVVTDSEWPKAEHPADESNFVAPVPGDGRYIAGCDPIVEGGDSKEVSVVKVENGVTEVMNTTDKILLMNGEEPNQVIRPITEEEGMKAAFENATVKMEVIDFSRTPTIDGDIPKEAISFEEVQVTDKSEPVTIVTVDIAKINAPERVKFAVGSDVADPKDQFVEHMVSISDHDRPLIQYFADEHFKDFMSLEQNVELYLKWSNKPLKREPEPTVDLSSIEGTYTVDEMPAVLDKIQEKIDEVKVDNNETFVFPTDLDNSSKLNPSLDVIAELEKTAAIGEGIQPVADLTAPVKIIDPIPIEEVFNSELEVPEEVRELGKKIEQRMISLYGSVRSFNYTENEERCFITIDATSEMFYVDK